MRHKNYDTLRLRNVCCVSLTILEVTGYRGVLLIHCWSVLAIQVGTFVASITRTTRWVNYTHWHQTAARTSQTRIILRHTSTLHASWWNIRKKKLQTVMWYCECEQSIHEQESRGLGLEEKSWPWSWQGHDFSLEAKAKKFIRCPQGQGQAGRTTRMTVTRWSSMEYCMPLLEEQTFWKMMSVIVERWPWKCHHCHVDLISSNFEVSSK